MCIFQKVTFHLYPENIRLRAFYSAQSDTPPRDIQLSHMRVRRKIQVAENKAANATKRVNVSPFRVPQAAETRPDYRA